MEERDEEKMKVCKIRGKLLNFIFLAAYVGTFPRIINRVLVQFLCIFVRVRPLVSYRSAEGIACIW